MLLSGQHLKKGDKRSREVVKRREGVIGVCDDSSIKVLLTVGG